MDHIYLDHNSTTPIDPAVADAMADCYRRGYVNPASQHRLGQVARKQLESCRSNIVRLLDGVHAGMQTDQLILTSGGTESNNLALIGIALARTAADPNIDKRVIVSSVEHPSIHGAADYLKSIGFQVDYLPVDSRGVYRLEELENQLTRSVAVTSLMLANHETGVLQPIREAASLCRAAGVPIHTDAVQAIGKIPVSFRKLDIDAMTFTPHKFNGPRGIGGLLLRHGVTLQPMLHGGFQQTGLRPGTEDVALTIGLETALERSVTHMGQHSTMLANLRDRLLSQLQSSLPELVVNGGDAPKTPQTLNISFPGIDRQALLMAADFQGLAISTGSACASGSTDPSPVLLAMKASPEVVAGAIRISVGMTNTFDEIDEAGRRLVKIIESF